MGVVTRLLDQFNDKYSRICHLDFLSIDKYVSVESTHSIIKENKATIQNVLRQNQIKIVDSINDTYSSQFCNDIQAILHEKYSIEATIGKHISKNHLNLHIIHNALYYKGISDPHNNSHDGIAVQHITLEDFMSNASAALSSVIHELLIKNDIKNKKNFIV